MCCLLPRRRHYYKICPIFLAAAVEGTVIIVKSRPNLHVQQKYKIRDLKSMNW